MEGSGKALRKRYHYLKWKVLILEFFDVPIRPTGASHLKKRSSKGVGISPYPINNAFELNQSIVALLYWRKRVRFVSPILSIMKQLLYLG